MKRKGIVLAGGAGSRLHPVTRVTSKQLLPVYNKPMIYYPLSVLMLAGIREVAIITTEREQGSFVDLLGDGTQWGISLTYITQPSPDGLAQAYTLAEDFLNDSSSALILGDNIFYGHAFTSILSRASNKMVGGTIFGYSVSNPERYGIVGFNENGEVNKIIEKPDVPPSNIAVTGLYFLDQHASEMAKSVMPSERGELEITSLLEMYLNENLLTLEQMGRGYAWLDTGTHTSLLDAGNFVRTLEERQGLLIGSPDEIAYLSDWISCEQLEKTAENFSQSDYGTYLKNLIKT